MLPVSITHIHDELHFHPLDKTAYECHGAIQPQILTVLLEGETSAPCVTVMPNPLIHPPAEPYLKANSGCTLATDKGLLYKVRC